MNERIVYFPFKISSDLIITALPFQTEALTNEIVTGVKRSDEWKRRIYDP